MERADGVAENSNIANLNNKSINMSSNAMLKYFQDEQSQTKRV